MRDDKRAEQILKQFAQEARNARIDYIDAFAGENKTVHAETERRAYGKSFYRKLRISMAAAVLTILATTAMVSAEGSGIKVSGLEVVEGNGELIIACDENAVTKENGDVSPMRIGYIPEGYELEYEEEFINGPFDIRQIYSREVDKNDTITIEQYYALGMKVTVSTYLAEVETIEAGNTGVLILDKNYKESKDDYIFLKKNMLVHIETSLPQEAVLKIIESMD